MEGRGGWGQNNQQQQPSNQFEMFADQLNEFTENIKSKFESRLTALDRAGADIYQDLDSLMSNII